MEVTYVKALADNYIWLLVEGEEVVVVDPGESQPVLDYLQAHSLELKAIWLTHNHADHTDGITAIKAHYPSCPVYGPQEVADWADHALKDQDQFDLWQMPVTVHLTAGHTPGHLSFLVADCLFCGDALFAAGCGRVFTKDYQAAYESMQYFRSLDDAVKVYAGHEYTQTNLRFALSLDPHSSVLQAALKACEARLKTGKASLPTTIGQERQINPFLMAKSLTEFKRLRDLRDDFS